MKSEGIVRQKVKQVVFRHLKAEIDASQSRRPCNCKHNFVEHISSGCIGLCSLKESDSVVCDEAKGGLYIAGKCPYFIPSKTVGDVKSEFQAFLRGSSLSEKAKRFPDLAALSWVLGSDAEEIPRMLEISPTGKVTLTLNTRETDSWSYYRVDLP